MVGEGFKAQHVLGDVVLIHQVFIDDDVQQCIQQRHVGPWCKAQHMIGMTAERLTARVHDNQFCARAFGGLEEGRCDRVVLRRARANNDHHVGLFGVGKRSRHRARSDAFHEGRDAGRVA